MRARAKTLTALVIVAVLTSPPATASDDACASLAVMRPQAVADALRSLSGEVLGKAADMWTEADFHNVIAHADACNGKPDGVQFRVNAGQWRHHMQAAAKTVLAVSHHTAAIRQAYAPRWFWGNVPSCISILNWRRDPVWHKDNSAELFGMRLRDMDAEARTLAVGFVRECVPVMETVLKANRMRTTDAVAVADDIASSATREGEAAKEDPDEIADRLQAAHDGERIPLAYIGETAKRMVAAANHAEKSGYRMSTEQLIMLSSWSDKVRNERSEGPERLYAEKVREFVRGQMFGRRPAR